MSHAPLYVVIRGQAAPQGSKSFVGRTKDGRPIMRESSKDVKPWRSDVKAAAEAAMPEDWTPIMSAVQIVAVFVRPRPKGHYRTGRFAGLLRDTAPPYPATTPDLDKLLRSTLDALGKKGASVWRDDAQVVRIVTDKIYATDEMAPGAILTITPME